MPLSTGRCHQRVINGVAGMQTVMSKTFDEIRPGDTACVQRTLQAGDVRAWTAAFADASALAESADGQGAAGIVTAILTGLAASALPGPGSSVRSASVQVKRPLPIDSALTVQLKVCDKRPPERLVLLDGLCTDPAGNVVASAMLEVLPPTTAVQRAVPEHRLEGLLERCRGLKPMLTGVVHPCSTDALAGAVEAAAAGLIEPVLFAPEAELHEVATAAKLDLSGCRIVATDGAEDSALKAAMAAGAGEVRGLMKGSLHTDVLLHAVVQKEAKLRTGRLLSHCALVSVPTYARRMVIVDGPLDLDAAVDAAAARIKHIASPVAGAADVLVVPNIEAGNMIYKNLAFMADAQTAGVVVGARVPIVLTSRAHVRLAPLLGCRRAALRRRSGPRSGERPSRGCGVTRNARCRRRIERRFHQPEVRRLHRR